MAATRPRKHQRHAGEWCATSVGRAGAPGRRRYHSVRPGGGANRISIHNRISHQVSIYLYSEAKSMRVIFLSSAYFGYVHTYAFDPAYYDAAERTSPIQPALVKR